MKNTGLRGLLAALVNAGEPNRMTYRQGPHGERVSLMGYGCMRLPTVDGKHANNWGEGVSSLPIDQKKVNAQVKHMLDRGMTMFDCAPPYCRGESERCLGEALAASGYRRDQYYVCSKLSNFSPSQFSFDACKKLFETSLKYLRTDYLDFYLLHSVGNGGMETFKRRYVENGIIPWLFEQKRLGRIRNLGFSYHGDPGALEWLLKKHDEGVYPWDVALIQLNYVDWHHAKQVNARNLNAEYLYKEISRRGIKMLVMEPLLGGRLAKHNDAIAAELTSLDPEATPARWALRFCGSHLDVISVLSGMTFDEHIDENIDTFSPLRSCTPAELIALERAAAAYLGCGAIPCNSCNYCMPCPYGLDIPGLLTFMNRVRMERIQDSKTLRREYAKAIPDPRRRADRCIGCKRCNQHCPQMIDIPKVIDGIASFMEDFT